MFDDSRAADLVAVGDVRPHSARLWLRAKRPGLHRLELWRTDRPHQIFSASFDVSDDPARDGTKSFQLPDDFAGAAELTPGTAYGFRIVRERPVEVVGEGCFETAPAAIDFAPERFSIAFMSCHQPFREDGTPHPKSLAMLAMLRDAFEARAVKRVIMLGDQMYSDYPASRSLFDPEWFARVAPPGRKSLLECTRAEIRALYQERYRIFWALEDYQKLQCCWPTYAIPDDHELVDNFGSDPEHASDGFRAIHDGALDACYDYQLARILGLPERPPSLHHSFEYGPFAAFLMDLRSERIADEQRVRIYSPAQLAALARFLADNARRPVVAIGLSVPLVHVPRWVADLGVGLTGESGDAADRWEYAKAKESRDGLLSLLAEHRRRHPEQQLVLLGGDIHAGVVSRIALDSADPLVQVVSSGVTNLERPLRRKVAKLVSTLQHETTIGDPPYAVRARLLRGERGHSVNPYAGLNVAILEHRKLAGDEWQLRIELISCNGDGGERVVYARDLGTALAS